MIHSLALMPLLISIHAPTRGATTGSGNLFGDSIISIHAPTRGATPMLQLRYSRKPISIHAPTRGATIGLHAIYATPVISIHAPTRGATYNGAKYFIHCADFNPRSHEGSDRSTGRLSTVLCISIHAPTRGAMVICFCNF